MNPNETITNLHEDSVEFSPIVAKNYRVIRAGLIDSEYRYRVGSEDIYNPSGLRLLLSDSLASAPILADGVTDSAYFNFPRPKEWSDGIIGVRWHLASDTSSATNVYIRTSLFGFGANDQIGNIGAGTLSYTYGYDVATYTAVTMNATKFKRTLFESNLVEFCVITNEIERIYCRVLRKGGDASDTHAGNLIVMGCEVYYFARKGQS